MADPKKDFPCRGRDDNSTISTDRALNPTLSLKRILVLWHHTHVRKNLQTTLQKSKSWGLFCCYWGGSVWVFLYFCRQWWAAGRKGIHFCCFLFVFLPEMETGCCNSLSPCLLPGIAAPLHSSPENGRKINYLIAILKRGWCYEIFLVCIFLDKSSNVKYVYKSKKWIH